LAQNRAAANFRKLAKQGGFGVGARHVLMITRRLAAPRDPGGMKAVNTLQDAIKVEWASSRPHD
jgi:hypothetical protein